MPRFIYLPLLLAMLAISFTAQAQPKAIAAFKGTYEELMQEAAKQKKPVIVHVETSWCGYCKQMKTQTYRHPEVIDKTNQSFLFYRMDAESPQGQPIADRYKVKSFPTVLYFNSFGRLLGKENGFQDYDLFLFNMEKYVKLQEKSLKKGK